MNGVFQKVLIMAPTPLVELIKTENGLWEVHITPHLPLLSPKREHSTPIHGPSRRLIDTTYHNQGYGTKQHIANGVIRLDQKSPN